MIGYEEMLLNANTIEASILDNQCSPFYIDVGVTRLTEILLESEGNLLEG